jgi:hypothetical protein
VLSITAIGASPVFDTSWHGGIAQALRRCAGDLTRRLGASGSPDTR